MHVVEMEQHQIGQLLKQNQELKASIDAQNDTINQLKQYILQLEEFIRHGRQKQFGPSSEQAANLHPSLFDEPEITSEEHAANAEEALEGTAEETTPKPARKPRKAFRIPPELP
ncbi:MAG: hypothetical protein HYV23_07535, partial [Deltaproteobacteria bacterium]|nr:hypothetical protein [Deltaproteobacteria bacterium]